MHDLRKFNINEYIWVKLTDRGREIILRDHQQFCAAHPQANLDPIPAVLRQETEDGFSKWQAWDLMQTLGPYIRMGGDILFETTVLIDFIE